MLSLPVYTGGSSSSRIPLTSPDTPRRKKFSLPHLMSRFGLFIIIIKKQNKKNNTFIYGAFPTVSLILKITMSFFCVCRYLSNWPGPMQMLMRQWPAMRHRDVEAHLPAEEASSMELCGTALLEVKQSKECRMQISGNSSIGAFITTNKY